MVTWACGQVGFYGRRIQSKQAYSMAARTHEHIAHIEREKGKGEERERRRGEEREGEGRKGEVGDIAYPSKEALS